MKRMLKVALLAGSCVGLWSVLARAENANVVNVDTQPDRIEVTARGVEPTDLVVNARGQSVEVPLAKAPPFTARMPVPGDSTIVSAELKNDERPRLTVRLKDALDSQPYAEAARVERTPTGIKLTIPRSLKPVAPVEVHIPPVVARSESPRPSTASAPAAGTEAVAAPIAHAPVIAAAGMNASAPLGLPDEKPLDVRASSTRPISLLVGLLAAIGIGLIAYAKRKPLVAAESKSGNLRVVATCALSPKVKLTLVAVGDHEVLLSVADQGAQTLARWTTEAVDEEDIEAETPLRAVHDTQEVPSVNRDAALAPTQLPRATPAIGIVASGRPSSASGPHVASVTGSKPSSASGPQPSSASGLQPSSASGLQPSTRAARASESPSLAGLLRLRREASGADGDAARGEAWARELRAAVSRTAARAEAAR